MFAYEKSASREICKKSECPEFFPCGLAGARDAWQGAPGGRGRLGARRLDRPAKCRLPTRPRQPQQRAKEEIVQERQLENIRLVSEDVA